MKTKKISPKLLTFIISISFLFSSCITSEQEYFINKDGSGKVKVEAQMPLEMDFNMGQDKSEKASHEDSVKMVKKVREIIKNADGIEAWKNVNYFLDGDGMLNISATAYFPDIKKVDLSEIPTMPVSKFNKDKIEWAGGDNLAKDMKTQKEMPEMDIQKDNIDETVDKIQQQFRQSKMMMGMMLSGFHLEATYHLPYKIKSETNLEKIDDYTVMQKLNGEKIFDRYEELIEDEDKLKQLIEEKNLQKFSLENPKLFEAAYPEGAMYSAQFRTGLFSPKPKIYFDYKKEVESLEKKIPEITLPKAKTPGNKKVYLKTPAGYKPYWGKNSSHHTAALHKNKLALYDNKSDGKYIEIYDIPSKKLDNQIEIGEFDFFHLFFKWSPEGDKIAIISQLRNSKEKGLLKIYNVNTKDLIAEQRFIAQPSDFVWVDHEKFTISFLNHDMLFATINDNRIDLGETFQISEEILPQGAINPSNLCILKTNEKEGKNFILSFDSKSHSLKIWDPYKEKLLRTVPVEKKGIPKELVPSPNPKYVALLLNKRIVIFVNGKFYKEITDIDQPLNGISWTPDGSKLIYINSNNELVYYNVTNGIKKVIYNPEQKLRSSFKVTYNGQYGLTRLKDYHQRYYFIKLQF